MSFLFKRTAPRAHQKFVPQKITYPYDFLFL